MMHVLRIGQSAAQGCKTGPVCDASFAGIARTDDWSQDNRWAPIVGADFARPMISATTPYRGSCNATKGVVVGKRRFRCPVVSE